MSKAFQLPDTTGARALIVMIEVDSDWEQSISLSIDGRDYGRYTGSGECMLRQLQLEPGRERDCQLICNHQAPGQSWTENEYIDPIIAVDIAGGDGNGALVIFLTPGIEIPIIQ